MPTLAGATITDELVGQGGNSSHLGAGLAPDGPVHPRAAVCRPGILGGASDLASAAAWPGAAVAAGARRRACAAFLSSPEIHGAATATSFSSEAQLPKTPKLGKLRLYLMFQTPEIYKTDVGEQNLLPTMGWKYACKFPMRDGLGPQAFLHPSIVFNGTVTNVHVHMEDRDTGEVFWDADYKLPPSLTWAALGKSELSSHLPAKRATVRFRQPCVPKDDHTTHHFDISIQTQDGYYDDNATPWGQLEGFKEFLGPKAHIGFDAKRHPLLENQPGGAQGLLNKVFGGALSSLMGKNDPSKPQKEIVGRWMRGSSYSRSGPVHDDRLDRVLAEEEDPFYDTASGKSHRGYYYHIILPSGRERKSYEWVDKYAPRAMRGMWTDEPLPTEKKHKHKHGQDDNGSKSEGDKSDKGSKSDSGSKSNSSSKSGHGRSSSRGHGSSSSNGNGNSMARSTANHMGGNDSNSGSQKGGAGVQGGDQAGQQGGAGGQGGGGEVVAQ